MAKKIGLEGMEFEGQGLESKKIKNKKNLYCIL